MKIWAAGFAGTLFGLGLAVSGMVNPGKVIGFLDVAGRWDPTLATVMGGALLVTVLGFRWILCRPRPWLADRFFVPARNDVDARLVVGAALFGIGWGIAGLCPGPAIASLATGLAPVAAFVAAMLAGAWLSDRFGAKSGRADKPLPSRQA